MGRPLEPLGYMSAITAPPIAIGAPPNTPAKKRKTISISRLEDSAQAIVKIENMTIQKRKRSVLPYKSANGPKSRGPIQNPSM